jgi:hypothetical protein
MNTRAFKKVSYSPGLFIYVRKCGLFFVLLIILYFLILCL